MAKNNHVSGITKNNISKNIFGHAAKLLDDTLTMIYRYAEKSATIGPVVDEDGNGRKVVDLEELRNLMEAAIKITYSKLDDM